MDQGSTMKRSAVHNFAPTVTKFCVMWEGQALPHDTKFGNSRCEIVGRRVIFIWSLIHGLRWSGLIKAEPGRRQAIMWSNLDVLSIKPHGTYFNEILFDMKIFSFKKMHLNMFSEKWQPFWSGKDEFIEREMSQWLQFKGRKTYWNIIRPCLWLGSNGTPF